jgi:hypothetical protein
MLLIALFRALSILLRRRSFIQGYVRLWAFCGGMFRF